MDPMTILCPACHQVTQDGHCGSCQVQLDDHHALFRLVCNAYNRSLAAYRTGDLVGAWSILADELPAFPFVDRICEFWFELSLELGRFEAAANAASWLSAFPEHGDRTELSARLADAVAAHNERERTQHAVVDAPVRPRSSRQRMRRIALVVSAVVLLAISYGWSDAIRRSRALQHEVATSRSALLDMEATSAVMADSVAFWRARAVERIEVSTPASVSTPDPWRERLLALGPHAAYRLLNLHDARFDRRIDSMEVFVDLFPDADAYTGAFLRELYDRLRASDPSRAQSYAQQLVSYCRNRPALRTELISTEIQRLTAGVSPDA